jgi:hypothetical protein
MSMIGTLPEDRPVMQIICFWSSWMVKKISVLPAVTVLAEVPHGTSFGILLKMDETDPGLEGLPLLPACDDSPVLLPRTPFGPPDSVDAGWPFTSELPVQPTSTEPAIDTAVTLHAICKYLQQ